MATCIIWGTPAIDKTPPGEDSHKYFSIRAGGEYYITRTMAGRINELTNDEKTLLTTLILNHNQYIKNCYCINDKTFSEIKNMKHNKMSERAFRLLTVLERQLTNIGARYVIKNDLGNEFNWLMMAWTETSNFNELKYLFDYLINIGYLDGQIASDAVNVKITVSGHDAISDSHSVITSSNQGFVAMWFDDSIDYIYNEGIKPAIILAGYDPVRLKHGEYLDRIDDEIISQIRRSKFVVADLTHGDDGVRGSVYYEAGLAFGLNIPIFYTCHTTKSKQIHFDVNHFPYIEYETIDTLKNKLKNKLEAILGAGRNIFK